MLTYELKKEPGMPLYEALYRFIRADILSGKLLPGTKLPSKRALCVNLEVSKITVENAYNQLLAEGYIRSREKVGYFVEAVDHGQSEICPETPPEKEPTPAVDLTANGPVGFPFSVWNRLQRAVMLDLGQDVLQSTETQGLWQLRQAIAMHLAQFRGMQVSARNILIGAGTDFLYNLLIQLLGRDKLYAVEDPGYGKIRKIYGAAGARCVSVEMDGDGILPEKLADAQVLHISPSHHFPTGVIMPLARRQTLLQWAQKDGDRWIIEDDYDSEFRFNAHPMPAIHTLDKAGKVIYMNTFSKTLAPAIRISYMILPDALTERFHKQLGFYSCTVPGFEQHTLARFISQGHFEKHINRMRKFYKIRRDRVLAAIAASPAAKRLAIREEHAGLHFLVQADAGMNASELVAVCARAGIKVRSLESYYRGAVPEKDKNCLVVNYSGLTDEALEKLERILQKGI